MSRALIVIEGTLHADGTLTLDENPNLPPGRVKVVLQQAAAIAFPDDDPFWQRMQVIWAIARSSPRDGGRNTLDEVRAARDEWEDGQQGLERLQEGPRP